MQEAGLVALEHIITKSHTNMTEGIAVVGAAGGLHATIEAIRHHVSNYQIALQASAIRSPLNAFSCRLFPTSSVTEGPSV